MNIRRTVRDAESLQRACDDFNSRHPVGTPIVYSEVIGFEPVRATTRSAAWVLGGHTAVILLNEKSGCVALSHVEIAP